MAAPVVAFLSVIELLLAPVTASENWVLRLAPTGKIVPLIWGTELSTVGATSFPELSTVTVERTVVVLPALSRAVADTVWDPVGASAVFHGVVYGAVRSSAPRLSPSTANWTPITAMLSV